MSNAQHSLASADLPHIFEPLRRKDATRKDSSRCGVCLKLVKHAPTRWEFVTPERFGMTVAFPCSRVAERNSTS